MTGASDAQLCKVTSAECKACCHYPVPSAEAPNPLVASTLFKALMQIREAGGVEGCGMARANDLMSFAGQFLLVLSRDGSSRLGAGTITETRREACLHIGAQTGERPCLTCRGNVRMKVYHCSHPRHLDTTLRACGSCPDHEPGGRRHAVQHWVVGATTDARGFRMLWRALSSIRRAGWDGRLYLFATPGMRVRWAALGHGRVLVVCRRRPSLGKWKNFLLSLAELYMREPGADAYLLVLDGAVFGSGWRGYLENHLWPAAEIGAVSLQAPDQSVPGSEARLLQVDPSWSISETQAFIFFPDAVRAFLSDAEVVHCCLGGMSHKEKEIDCVVRDWCTRTGREFWLHVPSSEAPNQRPAS